MWRTGLRTFKIVQILIYANFKERKFEFCKLNWRKLHKLKYAFKIGFWKRPCIFGALYIRVFHLITRLNVGLRQITENVEHKKTPTYVRNEASKTGGGRNCCCSFCGLLRTKVHLDKGWLFDMPEFYSDDAVRTENFFGNLFLL